MSAMGRKRTLASSRTAFRNYAQGTSWRPRAEENAAGLHGGTQALSAPGLPRGAGSLAIPVALLAIAISIAIVAMAVAAVH